MASLVTPKLPEDFRLTIRNCLALNITVSSVSWTRLEIESDRAFRVSDWQHVSIENKKFQTHELVQLALDISRSIPEADVYLIENPNRAPMMGNANATAINVNVEKAQLIAMLSALLMNRIARPEAPEAEGSEMPQPPTNLYFIKQFAAAKLFNTFVGNEKTSNNAVVMGLLGEDNSAQTQGWMSLLSDLKMDPLQLSPEVKNHFFGLASIEREFIGQSLLVGLTFIKMCLQNGIGLK